MDLNSHPDPGDAFSWVAALNTGLGVLLMTAFPFAVPILALTIALALPLVLLAVPLALPIGLVLIARRIFRRVLPPQPV
jgi:hypothetical protein